MSVHGQSAYHVARQAAAEAGKILRQRFGRYNETRVKGRRDLVTEADLLSEKTILQIITAAFPGHGIMSEEAGTKQGDGEYTWIIDPLDGTNNFHFGIPLFCVNIALARRGEVVMGITFDPMRNEIFRAVKGKGAYLNNRRTYVADVADLGDAAVGVDLGYDAGRSRELLDMAIGLWPKIHCMRLIGFLQPGYGLCSLRAAEPVFSQEPVPVGFGQRTAPHQGSRRRGDGFYEAAVPLLKTGRSSPPIPVLGRVFRDWLKQK